MSIPRNEHPNPQFERKNWENLNGKWEFEIDKDKSGEVRRLYEADKLQSEITVPFCPESKLSGVEDKDFLNSVWYKRTINVKETTDRIFLHIGACDYLTFLYVNGKMVGAHGGGFTSFSFDITDFVNAGENSIVINAVDDVKNPHQPSGKQSAKEESYGCFYTRITGIWQTVWLEYVPKNHIKFVKYYPDVENSKLTIKAEVQGEGEFTATAYYEGRCVGNASEESKHGKVVLELPLSEKHLWEAGCGRLYDLELTFCEDKVKSYFGLRKIELKDNKFLLNSKTVFLRTVLDQGYYPDGLYTAPNEKALINDIKIALDAGFNGARLHEKVFEPRFLYHCDKMGYLVFAEYGNWGFDHTDISGLPVFFSEWQEAIVRDFNHPAIIGWIPFNETWDIDDVRQNNAIIEAVYYLTKAHDETRPCIDASGGVHVVTDIFDAHDYTQNVDEFKKLRAEEEEKNTVLGQIERAFGYENRHIYKGEPTFISEYGGIKWDTKSDSNAWGYGDAPKTEEEFIERYKNLTETLLNCKKHIGFCYTQLYDIEQETNGLYNYDRTPKFDINIFKEINTQKAAIED